MLNQSSIKLTPAEITIIKNILLGHFPNGQFWIYGSRTRGDSKKYSDVDILIKSSQKINPIKLGDAKEDLAKSNLVYLVDLVDWYGTSSKFLTNIEQDLFKIN